MSGIKIDLKALKNSYNPKKDDIRTNEEKDTSQNSVQKQVEVSTSQIEESSPNISPITLIEPANIKADDSVYIKNSITDETIQTTEEVIKEQKIELSEKKSESEEEERKKSPLKSTKINLMGIKSLDNTDEEIKKVEVAKKDEVNIEEKEIKADRESKNENKNETDKEIFTQYKSDFVKNKETIIDRIKKLKNIPKTRIGFVLLLILISFIGIGSLFILNPKMHSIENYKASILEIFKEPEPIIEKHTIVKEPPIKDKDIVIPSKIVKGGINIIYESKIVNGQEIIIYNGKTYSSRAEFEMELNKIVEKLKIGKLTDFLKNK